MGGEFAQWHEWHHDGQLQWDLLEHAPHRAVQRWVAALNAAYRSEPALHQLDCDSAGFEWIDANDMELSVLSFLRKAQSQENVLLVVCNFTPVPRHNYRLGVPRGGFWRELLNSDAVENGGSGMGNLGGVEASPLPHHGRPFSLTLTLPPLSALFLKP
jgi:1,4-alpha-glucan branching enzyme